MNKTCVLHGVETQTAYSRGGQKFPRPPLAERFHQTKRAPRWPPISSKTTSSRRLKRTEIFQLARVIAPSERHCAIQTFPSDPLAPFPHAETRCRPVVPLFFVRLFPTAAMDHFYRDRGAMNTRDAASTLILGCPCE